MLTSLLSHYTFIILPDLEQNTITEVSAIFQLPVKHATNLSSMKLTARTTRKLAQRLPISGFGWVLK